MWQGFSSAKKEFCSNECKQKFLHKKLVEDWKNGIENRVSDKQDIRLFIRKYLYEKHDGKCEICGWNEINPYTNKVPLQIHHIDGNCLNNSEDNLQLLCPNCHSLTPTFGRLNKKSSRKR